MPYNVNDSHAVMRHNEALLEGKNRGIKRSRRVLIEVNREQEHV